MSKMKTKFIILGVMTFLVIGIAAAGLISNYFSHNATLNVENPISVDGAETYTISGVMAGGEPFLGDAITVNNAADFPVTVQVTDNSGLHVNDGIDVSYVGKVELTTKDTEWQPTTERKVDVVYTLVGEEFNAEVELESGEVLVYALDHDDRWTDYASVIKVEDIEGDLPYSEDWNADAEPNYCDNNNGFDDYEHCNGAKLWVVKQSDLGTAVDGVYPLNWANMNTYLYETDLIQYFDNANGEITVPANSFIEFYPEYTTSVSLEGGSYTIVTEVNPLE